MTFSEYVASLSDHRDTSIVLGLLVSIAIVGFLVLYNRIADKQRLVVGIGSLALIFIFTYVSTAISENLLTRPNPTGPLTLLYAYLRTYTRTAAYCVILLMSLYIGVVLIDAQMTHAIVYDKIFTHASWYVVPIVFYVVEHIAHLLIGGVDAHLDSKYHGWLGRLKVLMHPPDFTKNVLHVRHASVIGVGAVFVACYGLLRRSSLPNDSGFVMLISTTIACLGLIWSRV